MNDLPALPQPAKQVAVAGYHDAELRDALEDYFDADQMRDYAIAALTAHARPVDEACGLLAEAAKVLDSNGIAWALARDLERAALTSNHRNDVGVTRRARIAHLTAVLGRIAKMGGPAAESARLALADEDDALVLEEREQPAQATPAAVDALSIPVSTLRYWRELVDTNPGDLAPRMDRYLTQEASDGR